MKYTAVYSDGNGNWIFCTRMKGEGGLQYGVHVNPQGRVSVETPVASIVAWMPDSDYRPFNGEVPASIKQLVEQIPEPTETE